MVKLPGYSPDLNPIERLWDRMREEVTRGLCHGSVTQLIAAYDDTRVSALCAEPGIARQTLYRHVDAEGNLRPDDQKLLNSGKQATTKNT